MTEAEFERRMERFELEYEYSEYLMNHTDARIGNGTMLINAIESGNYYDGFKEYLTNDK